MKHDDSIDKIMENNINLIKAKFNVDIKFTERNKRYGYDKFVLSKGDIKFGLVLDHATKLLSESFLKMIENRLQRELANQ